MLVFFVSDASMLNEPGPRIVPRPVLPYVPVFSVVGVKQDRSNHLSIVGFESEPSQIWFGRLPVPVESTPCDCVTVSGRPPRHVRMPPSCQPPYGSVWAHGIS